MSRTLRPFLPSHLGFDRLFEELERAIDRGPESQSYPPFNVIKESDGYTIEVAIAGFKKNEIKIEHDKKSQQLLISGSNPSETKVEREYVKHGIGRRSFNLSFKVSNDHMVDDASLEDGILTVFLKQLKTEESKPLLINIK